MSRLLKDGINIRVQGLLRLCLLGGPILLHTWHTCMRDTWCDIYPALYLVRAGFQRKGIRLLNMIYTIYIYFEVYIYWSTKHMNISCRTFVGCLWFTKFCWVGKHKILLRNRRTPQPKAKPTHENKVKGGIWATFSHSKYLFVGRDWLYIGNRLQETQPNQILRKHPILNWEWGLIAPA